MNSDPFADREAHDAVLNSIKAGAPIPPSDATMIERWWDVMSDVPRERRGHVAIGLGAIAGPNPTPLNPEQAVGFMMRSAILCGLEERGLLQEYLAQAELKKKLFEVIASVPLSLDDFGEAVVERVLREGPAEEIAKLRQELAAKGLDPDRPRIISRLASQIHGGKT